MTITYANGQKMQAALVARADDKIRVAFPGGDDVVEFTHINGTWVSEDCEAATIDFHGPRHRTEPVYSDEAFVCPEALAAKLIQLLIQGDHAEGELPASVNSPVEAPANGLVV